MPIESIDFWSEARCSLLNHEAGSAIELHTNPVACDTLGSSGPDASPGAESAAKDAPGAEKDAIAIMLTEKRATMHIEKEDVAMATMHNAAIAEKDATIAERDATIAAMR